MTYPNLTFSRNLLKQGHALVKKHFPNINVVKDGFVIHFHQNCWEFRGPDKFRWRGNASNAYEAKHEGWMAYLKSKGKEV